MQTRRTFTKRSLTALGLASFSSFLSCTSSSETRKFPIGACDWSIGKHSDVTALGLAHEIGLDGVQVSLGKQKNDMHLRREDIQQAYRQAAQEHGVQVGGMAIGELNNVPYKSAAITEQWVSDSIDVAAKLGVKNVLLAFFGKGDLKDDKAGTEEVIRRLKKVAPKAEDRGVVLGIESWLSAKEHMYIIDKVGSDHVQVYYDVANSNKMGYNIYEEIRWLGKEQICEFHLKENGNLLGQGVVDFPKVRKAIDDIGYEGWVVIEGAIPQGAEILPSYKKNCAYVADLFG